MQTLAKRVAKTRADKGWSQSELARLVSQRRRALGKSPVKQQSINQLELGGVDSPRYLLELAEVLGVDAGWLTGSKPAASVGAPPVDEQRDSIFRIPLVSWVEAGEMAEASDPYLPGDAEEWLPISHHHGQLMALRVKGGSMDRIAPEGTIVVVDLADRSLIDGKHYIFRHEGRATFKTYRRGPPARLEPQSTDPDYVPIVPEDGLEVVGRVIRKTEEI